MPRICITGGAGFIGYHAGIALKKSGYDVIGFDNFNDYYDPKLKWDRLTELNKHDIPVFDFDLKEKHNVEKFMRDRQPDIILHLGAYAGVRHSLDDPDKYIQNNIIGTHNLIDACQKYNINKIIYASTSCVMAGNKLPWKEDDKCGYQLNPYGYTKMTNESQMMASKIPVTVGLRFFTVYGPWGRPDMALYIFTKKILAGETIDVFGFGKMRRDFTYIDDIVEGVFSLLDQKPSGASNWSGKNPNPSNSSAPWEIFNIGNNKPTELEYFISLIEKNLNKKAIKNYLEMQPGDVEETAADISKLNQITGFVPSTSIEDGIPKFISWYRTFHN